MHALLRMNSNLSTHVPSTGKIFRWNRSIELLKVGPSINLVGITHMVWDHSPSISFKNYTLIWDLNPKIITTRHAVVAPYMSTKARVWKEELAMVYGHQSIVPIHYLCQKQNPTSTCVIKMLYVQYHADISTPLKRFIILIIRTESSINII